MILNPQHNESIPRWIKSSVQSLQQTEFNCLPLSLEGFFISWGSAVSVLGNLIIAYLDDLVHLVYSMDSHWSGPGGILPQTIQFKRHLPCMNGLPCLTLSVKCRSTSRTAVKPSSSAVLCMPGFHSKGVHAHCYPELIRKESIVLPHSRSSCQSTHFCWSIYAISLSERTFCHRWFSVVAPLSIFL